MADAGEQCRLSVARPLADLCEQWRETVKLTRRPGTVVLRLALDNHILPAFGKDEPKAFTRNRIEAWHGEIAQRTPIQANRSLGVLSSFMTWLEHDHLIDRQPVPGIRTLSRANAMSISMPNRSRPPMRPWMATTIALRHWRFGCTFYRLPDRRGPETHQGTARQRPQVLDQTGGDHETEKTAHRAVAARGDGHCQGFAVHRLAGLRGLQALLETGTQDYRSRGCSHS